MSKNTPPYHPQPKATKWRAFLDFLIAANVITIVMPWVIYGASLLQNQFSPTQKTAWDILWGSLALIPLWYLGIIIAAVNIVAALTYAVAYKPSRNIIILNLLVCLLSAAYIMVLFMQTRG